MSFAITFTGASSGQSHTAGIAVWDWPLDAPVKVIAKDTAGRPLELVPYGCTKLRVSMFPVE